MVEPSFGAGTQEARDRALQGAMTLRKSLVKELPEKYDVEILAALTRRLDRGKGRCMVTVRSVTGHVLHKKFGLERENMGHNMMKAAYYMTCMILEELGGVHVVSTFRHNAKTSHTNYGSRVYKLDLDWWESE